MLPKALEVAFKTSIAHVLKAKEKIKVSGIKMKHHDKIIKVTLTITPLKFKSVDRDSYLLIFSEDKNSSLATSESNKLFDESINLDQYTFNLEEEIKNLKDQLQVTYEKLDASNENMQSFNEEIISANEEMQSTNEEMQSVNEELHTINSDYQLKNKKLL